MEFEARDLFSRQVKLTNSCCSFYDIAFKLTNNYFVPIRSMHLVISTGFTQHTSHYKPTHLHAISTVIFR